MSGERIVGGVIEEGKMQRIWLRRHLLKISEFSEFKIPKVKCHYKQLNPTSACRQEENVAFHKNKLIQYGQKHKFLVLSQHVDKNPRTHLINNKHVNWNNSVENKLANNYSHNHLLLKMDSPEDTVFFTLLAWTWIPLSTTSWIRRIYFLWCDEFIMQIIHHFGNTLVKSDVFIAIRPCCFLPNHIGLLNCKKRTQRQRVVNMLECVSECFWSSYAGKDTEDGQGFRWA